MGDAPVKRKLTFRRLSGLDRSGPPPPETVAGAPLRPWTIPNAIGYVAMGTLVLGCCLIAEKGKLFGVSPEYAHAPIVAD